MKTQKLLNILAFLLVVVGINFKMMHWPGANIMLDLSCLTMVITLFAFGIKDNREAGMSDGLNYFLTGLLTVFIVGILFKFMHWPGAGIFVVSAYFLAFLSPIILMLQKDTFKVGQQFIITFSIYFIMLISLFPHNPIHQLCGNGDANATCPHHTQCEK